ncbi:MCE family protein [Nocardia higoensis]|uniref:MCE family protein n=2 Tax=Nocardia higoensis TaxID=228599 RepID=A0ABS0DB59_9NOCA|nr:MCE family protein [Nocardia higoensis]
MRRRITVVLHRPLDEYSKLWLGVVSIAVLIAVVVGTLIVGSLEVGKTRYWAEFTQIAELAPGDKVSLAGVTVGKVESTRLAGDHVLVAMSIDTGTPLGADTEASIKLTTLLGSRYVELRPAGSGEIPDRTIRLADTSVPYDLQDTLEDATGTFAAVDADGLDRTLTTLATQLEGLPALMPQAVANIHTLSTLIADRRDQIGSLLASTREITRVLSDQRASLGTLMSHAAVLLAELAGRRQAIQNLLDSTTTLIDQLHRIVVADRGSLDVLLTDLRAVTQLLSTHDELFRNILQIAPVTVRNLANGFGSENALDAMVPAGPFIDSWMCALSGRASQSKLAEYLKDCR